MLKDLLENSKLKSEIRKFYKQHRDNIIDILVFGSTVRRKRKPKDIDILLIFNEKEDIDLSHRLRKVLEKFFTNIQITTRTYQNMFDSTFLARESILSEGYSLIHDKKYSECFGFKSFTLFIYTLKGFSTSKRMRFQYALNGRGKRKGMLSETNGVKLSNTTILIPVENSEEFKDFLDAWEIEYRSVSILIPRRVVDYKEFKL